MIAECLHENRLQKLDRNGSERHQCEGGQVGVAETFEPSPQNGPYYLSGVGRLPRPIKSGKSAVAGPDATGVPRYGQAMAERKSTPYRPYDTQEASRAKPGHTPTSIAIQLDLRPKRGERNEHDSRSEQDSNRIRTVSATFRFARVAAARVDVRPAGAKVRVDCVCLLLDAAALEAVVLFAGAFFVD